MCKLRLKLNKSGATMSLLPLTSATVGTLGFFAGATGLASIGPCFIGGIILWPLSFYLQTKFPGINILNEVGLSIPAAVVGALVCGFPITQAILSASVGAALLLVAIRVLPFVEGQHGRHLLDCEVKSILGC